MGVFENLPYTNFHELNLDWIVKKIRILESKTYDAAPEKVTTIADGDSGEVAGDQKLYRIGKLIAGYVKGELTDTANNNSVLLTGLPLPSGYSYTTVAIFEDHLTHAQHTVKVSIVIDGAFGALIIQANKDPEVDLLTGDSFIVPLSYFSQDLENEEEE